MVVCVVNAIAASQSSNDALKNDTDLDTKKERLEWKKNDFTEDGSIKTFLGASAK